MNRLQPRFIFVLFGLGLLVAFYFAGPITIVLGLIFLGGIVAVPIGIRASSRRLDSTVALSPLQIPEDPNPLELAYLVGGVDGVIRLELMRLLDCGCLRTRGPHQGELEWVGHCKAGIHQPAMYTIFADWFTELDSFGRSRPTRRTRDLF